MWRKFLVGVLALSPVWAQGRIQLKSRIISTPKSAVTRVEGFAGRRHYILQFEQSPGPALRRELARRGVRVLNYVPDSGLMVSSEAGVELGGLGATWVGELDPADKVSPAAAEARSTAYLIVFHPDADSDLARALILQRGFTLLENRQLLPGQFLASGNPAKLEELAASDDVAYILPASAELAAGLPLHSCPGASAEAGLANEYAFVGRGWPKDRTGVAALQYAFSTFDTQTNPLAARSTIERALREWARYADLQFEPGSAPGAPRTLAVTFARRGHGDEHPFDGRGGVLAHAYFPAPPNEEPIAGDIHFDGDEDWDTTADLFTVALHEAGHAVGLGHSDHPGSVMYPYYGSATGLASDDIAAIRALYGNAETVKPPDPPPTPTTPPIVPPRDTVPPALRITFPTTTILSAYSASIRIAGTSSDNTAVVAVKWTTSTGKSGTAAGTRSWSAEVPLLIGSNVITIRAYDAAGNSSWRALMVVRR